MKTILKLKYLIFFLLFVGCDDLSETVFSDLTQEGYAYSPDEIYSVIAPVYQNMRGFNGHRTFSACQEQTTDLQCQPANASGWDDGGIYKNMHLHRWNSESTQIWQQWQILYRGVMHANRIIEQLEEELVPVPAGLNRQSLIAEMKVARAFYYWLLIDNYGDVPYITDTSLEMPSLTDRATVYESIVSEVNSVLNDLSVATDVTMYGRFNRWGAYALLANLYLNAEVYTGNAEWDKCIAACDAIIASGNYSMEDNFEDCFSADNHNSSETIFPFIYDEINGPGLFINMILHASSRAKYNLRHTPWGAGSQKAITQFVNTYDPDDERIDATWDHGPQFAADGVTPLLCVYDRAGEQLDYSKDLPDGLYTTEDAGWRLMKFRPEMGAAFAMNNDFPFFRYTQVLMMKAESLLRKGQADDAAVIVTQVRQRAFKANPEKATVTGADLLADTRYEWGYVEDFVIVDPGDTSPLQYGGFYDELGWEFVGEWHRRRDMIRFGTFTTRSWLSHQPMGADRATFPIPQQVVDANPNIQ